jgi:hypothetical protein
MIYLCSTPGDISLRGSGRRLVCSRSFASNALGGLRWVENPLRGWTPDFDFPVSAFPLLFRMNSSLLTPLICRFSILTRRLNVSVEQSAVDLAYSSTPEHSCTIV